MEHLRKQFHEELDSDGDIVIAGDTFVRHDILEGLAEQTYKLAFEEWVETRKERMIEKADEILSLYDNRNRFEALRRTFQSGSMLAFIGAGLSMPSGFPSWTKFLYDLCDESHVKADDLRAALEKGLYEEAAEMLCRDLGAALFNENVHTTFGRSPSPAGPINYLPKLFPACSLLTTNFDCLIEEVYKGEGCQGFDKTVCGKVIAEVSRLMAGGSRVLVKIHGKCDEVADRVLTLGEYSAAYADKSAVKLFFNQVMFGRSLLFLGCSLATDRTITTMKELVKEYGSGNLPRHHALLELKGSDDRVARKKELAACRTLPRREADAKNSAWLPAL